MSSGATRKADNKISSIDDATHLGDGFEAAIATQPPFTPTKEGLNTDHVSVDPPLTEDQKDAEYDMIDRSEADEYYDVHGLPRESANDRIHREWLGKNLVQKQDRIIVEFGPHKIYKEFRLNMIPPTSKLLHKIAKRPPFDRHIWLPQVDEDVFASYFYLQAGNRLCWSRPWIYLLKMTAATEVLEDDVVKVQAIGMLNIKTQVENHRVMGMFSREDLDWVYTHTNEGHMLRNLVVVLAVQCEGLVKHLKGPYKFLSEVQVYLQDLKDRNEKVPDLGIDIPKVLSRSSNADTSWMSMSRDDGDLPRIRSLEDLGEEIPGVVSEISPTSTSKQDDAPSSPYNRPTPSSAPKDAHSPTPNLAASPPQKFFVPPTIPPPPIFREYSGKEGPASERYPKFVETSGNKDAMMSTLSMLAATYVPSTSRLPSTPMPSPSSTYPPTLSHSTSALSPVFPHGSSSTQHPTSPQIATTPSPVDIPRSTIPPPEERDPREVLRLLSRKALDTPSPTSHVATPAPTPKPLIPNGAKVKPTTPHSGLRYSNSVLRGKLAARPDAGARAPGQSAKSGVGVGSGGGAKQEPLRQPTNPPSVDALKRESDRNFAKMKWPNVVTEWT